MSHKPVDSQKFQTMNELRHHYQQFLNVNILNKGVNNEISVSLKDFNDGKMGQWTQSIANSFAQEAQRIYSNSTHYSEKGKINIEHIRTQWSIWSPLVTVYFNKHAILDYKFFKYLKIIVFGEAFIDDWDEMNKLVFRAKCKVAFPCHNSGRPLSGSRKLVPPLNMHLLPACLQVGSKRTVKKQKRSKEEE